ncbi:MAG: hypothetical protein AAFQ54_08505 [Pseudomonadota bacterium]
MILPLPRFLCASALCAAVLSICAVSASGEAITKPMNWTPGSGLTPGPIEGTSVVLEKGAFGAAMALKSSGLTPGEVVTVWWVVIQNPSVCAESPCTPVETMSDGAASDAVVTLAAGGVVAEDGTISLASYLPKGEVEGNFFETTFHSPEIAEYHLPVHNHGPLDPAIADEMLTSFRAGCSDDSLPEYYPQSAISDGVAGSFDCKTVQVVFFPSDE